MEGIDLSIAIVFKETFTRDEVKIEKARFSA